MQLSRFIERLATIYEENGDCSVIDVDLQEVEVPEFDPNIGAVVLEFRESPDDLDLDMSSR